MNVRVMLAFMALALCAPAASCSSCDDEPSCERGDCRAGNCLVNGECVEVVGRPCAANADCVSGICMAKARRKGVRPNTGVFQAETVMDALHR